MIACSSRVVHEHTALISSFIVTDELRIFDFYFFNAHDTIRYDSGYLTCSKKLTGSQLGLPHGINRKLKCETKNKMMSIYDWLEAGQSCGCI